MIKLKPAKPRAKNAGIAAIPELLDDFDNIRTKHKLSVSRSQMVQVLMKIAIESSEYISLDNVETEEDLKKALIRAFKKLKT